METNHDKAKSTKERNNMTTYCIVDIDTTLANNDHRAAMLYQQCLKCTIKQGSDNAQCLFCKEDGKLVTPQEAWDAFLDPNLLEKDTPVPHAREVLNHMRMKGFQIHFMTGRNARLKAVTEQWLRDHMDWNENTEELMVRSSNGPASEFKEAAFIDFCKRNSHGPYSQSQFLFFEDDPYVLHVWKKYGLVFLCPEAWETMNPETKEPAVEPLWRR